MGVQPWTSEPGLDEAHGVTGVLRTYGDKAVYQNRTWGQDGCRSRIRGLMSPCVCARRWSGPREGSPLSTGTLSPPSREKE